MWYNFHYLVMKQDKNLVCQLNECHRHCQAGKTERY